jgi:hypothetical protein
MNYFNYELLLILNYLLCIIINYESLLWIILIMNYY